MSNAANEAAYGQPMYGAPAWGNASNDPNQPWSGPPFWHPAGLSRPLGIVAMILAFVYWWPVGLALLFLLKWSSHMGCWGRRQSAHGRDNNGPGPFQGWATPWKNWNARPDTARPWVAPSSGNHAFDEYRAATLRRLEEEQQEFGSFLERLRFAKDKAEFDQFMAERRERPAPPPADRPTA